MKQKMAQQLKPWKPTKAMPCPIVSRCCSCKEYKCITEYYKSRGSTKGKRRTSNGEYFIMTCKQCSSRKYKESSIEQKLLNAAKKRAKTKGIEFSLSIADIVIPSYCPMLNIPLYPTSGQAAHANSPSIDRLDSSKGYVPENIVIISHRANMIKSNSTPVEMRMIADYTEKEIERREHLRQL